MNLAGVPVEMLYEQLIYPQMQAQVGRRFKIAHLKSAKGKSLNGKTCEVTGFDRNEEARLHCQIIGTGENPVRVKFQNLIPLAANEALENFMSASTPLSDEVLLPCLDAAIETHSFETDREDLQHRIRLYKELAQKIRDGTAQNDDYCLPCGAGNEQLNSEDNFGRVMQMMRPACFGDETCDLRFMDIGLKGDNQTECSVCQEVLTDDTKLVLVTLPCLHIFHKSCIQNWLKSDLGQENWNCPYCRHPVPGDMSIYCIEHQEQLQRRINEYPLSGFCTKCMIMVMECNRHQPMAHAM